MNVLFSSIAFAAPCSTTPPTGFVVAVGYGQGAEADALRAAREDARARLLAQACAGLTTARCQGLARLLRDWEQGVWDPKERSVCATAAIQREALQGFERDAANYQADLAKLALAAVDAAADRTVSVRTPTWPGCPAGALGEGIAAQVRNAMATSGRVVERGDLELGLVLVPSGHGLTVNATLGGAALPGFDVSADVLGQEVPAAPCSTSPARPAAAVGTVLVDGQPRTETHWIGACTGAELDGAMLAANQLRDAEARARAAAVVGGHRAELQRLCAGYERFQVPAEEYARRTEELTRWAMGAVTAMLAGGPVAADTPAAEQLSLEVRPVRSDGRPLASGDIVRRGDTFELRAKPSADAYVYVVYENSSGETAILPERGAAAFAPAGTWVELPSPGFEFVTDDQAGRTELIHVVASPTAIAAEDLAPGAIARVRARGFGVQPKPVGSTGGATFYGDAEGVAAGYGAVLWTLALDHR